VFILPVFKNGTVARVTIPKTVLRHLGVAAGDYVTMEAIGLRGVVVRKLDLQKVKDERVRGGAGRLDLRAGGADAPGDGSGRAR